MADNNRSARPASSESAGWDAYGLPAERYAVRTGVHPAITTKRTIETFRAQVKRLGFSYEMPRARMAAGNSS